MNLITPDWPVPKNVKAFSSLRTGGFSKSPYGDSMGGLGLNFAMHVGDDPDAVAKNRALLRTHLPSDPVWLNQIHGATVVNAALVTGVPDADASWTEELDKVCVIMTADCLPVLFCSMDGKVVGASHGGWRGLAFGILHNTVKAMQSRSSAEIMAWLGPAIGPKVFEVGQDVLDIFASRYPDLDINEAFVPEEGVKGKYFADIYSIARKILLQLGINAVYGGQACTVANPERYYSYRRDKGTTGRMATGIWLASA